MEHPRLFSPEPLKLAYGKIGQYRRIQQPKRKTGSFKGKRVERWHRAVSTNLARQSVLVPKEESLSESDLEFHATENHQKRNLVKKMKTVLGKVLSCRCGSQSAHAGRGSSAGQKEATLSNTQGLLLSRLVKELPSPRLFTKPRMRKLSQNATIQLDVVEAEAEEVTGGNQLLRARTTTKRLSVTSLPPGLQKVDDLIERVTDKCTKLLAQRHAELQQCEFLGAEILQSSKQFQRLSKRTTRKYKLSSTCCPCACCCL
ncbi:hypothetical protein ACRRTK_004763 [Alexandromys fortis]